MSSIKCPRCNVMVEIRPTVVHGMVVDMNISNERQTIKTNAKYDAEALWQSHQRPGYTVIDCGNCNGRFVVEHEKGMSAGYQRATAVWPLPNIQVENEVPEPIREALEDAKKAHSVGAEIAALLAARTALIRMQREQGVNSLKGLVDSGKLTGTLYRQADEVGNGQICKATMTFLQERSRPRMLKNY